MAVVAAVIEEDHRFLVTRRSADVHLGGMWEFPGGKVDPGESQRAALKREIREELGVEIEIDQLLHQTTHVYPERAVTLYFYRCRLLGTPHAILGQEMCWVPRAGLSSLGLPPADAELIELLIETDAR
jgi:8-oxo-dGTP diphosphatase